MTQDQSSFELERFELIPATPVHALLRVRGRWNVREGSHAAPGLVVLAGAQQHRFEALDPKDAAIVAGASEWSAAYATPVALLEDPQTTFWLDGPGGRIILPAPAEASPGETRLRERRVTPDRRREDGKRVPAHEERRSGVDRRRQRSYAELRAFRQEVSRLEARVEDLTERAQAAEARTAAQAERVRKLEAALAERVGHIHALEVRAAEAEERFEPLDSELAAVHERLTVTESALDDAGRQRQALEAELAEAAEARQALEAELAQAGENATRLTAEATAAVERADGNQLRARLADVAAERDKALEEVMRLRRQLRERESALQQAQAEAARTAGASSERDTARVAELVSLVEGQSEMVELAEAAAAAARAELEELRNRAG